MDTLDYLEPGSMQKAKNGYWSGAFYKVIKDERPRMYGWSCISRLISSKIKDGAEENNQFNETAKDIVQFIEDFKKKYPKANLKIEI